MTARKKLLETASYAIDALLIALAFISIVLILSMIGASFLVALLLGLSMAWGLGIARDELAAKAKALEKADG